MKASELHRTQPDLLERLWKACADATFSLEPRVRQLGLGDEVTLHPEIEKERGRRGEGRKKERERE